MGSQVLEEQSPLFRIVLRYGIALVMMVFYATTALHFDYTPDDTYIYLQYAKSIAAGDGFSFNDATPAYGVTGPLWAGIIGVGTALGVDPYVAAKTLDLLFASLAILVLYILAFVILQDKLFALIVAWMFSFDAWFVRWTATGLETSLAVLLSLLVIWYAYRKEYGIASFVAGVLTLVRPEGALIMLAVAGDIVLHERKGGDRSLRILRAWLTFGAVVGVWMVIAVTHFGTIVPNVVTTFLDTPFDGMNYLLGWLSTMNILGATQGVVIVTMIAGLVWLVRFRGVSILRDEGFILLWAFSVPLFFSVFHIPVGSRDFVPGIPLFILFAAWGIKRLERSAMLSPQKAMLLVLLLAGVSLAQNQYVVQTLVKPHMNNYSLGMEECLRPIAYWLRTNTKEEATVLTPNPGLLRYVSERMVYETTGVMTPQVRKAFQGMRYDEWMIAGGYRESVDPDFILDRSHVPNRLASDSLKPVLTRPFSGLSLSKTELVYFTLYQRNR